MVGGRLEGANGSFRKIINAYEELNPPELKEVVTFWIE